METGDGALGDCRSDAVNSQAQGACFEIQTPGDGLAALDLGLALILVVLDE
jgi:hypothetical protein